MKLYINTQYGKNPYVRYSLVVNNCVYYFNKDITCILRSIALKDACEWLVHPINKPANRLQLIKLMPNILKFNVLQK